MRAHPPDPLRPVFNIELLSARKLLEEKTEHEIGLIKCLKKRGGGEVEGLEWRVKREMGEDMVNISTAWLLLGK